ncbi:hypothetical protein GCK72_018037 [Caenorhabditis remanei]|uniref:SXP/RAL-2 family protein Ani s 5-like cation-binding domain-containing protein n=1 Tax=Caenorhabditis remanei TaxID=31234 RepID=E3LPJ6_CAERE|nr:hypothetical protein GCK72_018037 [Caenorhabditis remanei]EFP05360.1 hypothetical protein CRE_26969 [Caenorhabditis remanei]KAF1751483.1 hypothetical protein GCK72_018037 [Caenorhabditis remanei]
MCKLFVAVALIAVVCAHPAIPTEDQMKAELVAAGISDAASAGIAKIAESYKSQFEPVKGDHEAAKAVFDKLKTETDTYIATQSEADQTAYKAFVEKKKDEFKAHKEAASA